MADWLSLGATLAGGLLGAKAGGDTKSTATKDPWAPAQPYMLQNLKNEAALQENLQKNPFNQQQIEGYSNLFGDIGNFRNNVMPGLMGFANQGMTSGYQRQTGGSVGGGGGYGGAVQPGGMRQSGQGPFSVNRGAGQGVNGLLDLNGAQNPHVNGAIKAPATAAMTAPPGLLGTQQDGGRGGDYEGRDQGGYRDPSDPDSNPLGLDRYGSSFNPTFNADTLAAIVANPALGLGKFLTDSTNFNVRDIAAETEAYNAFEARRLAELRMRDGSDRGDRGFGHGEGQSTAGADRGYSDGSGNGNRSGL